MKIAILRDRNILNTKWLVSFVNLLRKRGFDITIIGDTYSKEGSGPEPLDKSVKLINLNAKTNNPIVNAYRKFRGKFLMPYFRFSKAIKQVNPDIIITYFPVDLFNATFFQDHKVPIIQMLHNYPPQGLAKARYKKGRYLESFKRVDVFQVLLPSYKNLIPQEFCPKMVVDIPNIVLTPDSKHLKNHDKETKKIVYVGRVEEKGKRQHLLVEAFGLVAKDFPNWSVEFWGTAKYPDYDKKIMDTAKRYGIEDRVSLNGYNENITEVYASADINAFPSAYEGFGLGLADGMAVGLPSIGFANAYGVNELIVDGYNGFLVNDVDEFAQKLKELMADKELRKELGKNAIKSMEKYNHKSVVDAWDELIKKTVEENK